MKKHLATMLLLSVLLTAFVPAVVSAESTSRLMLYSSLPAVQLDMMVDMFMDKYPGIKVDVFAANANDVFARAQSESGNAQGDVVLGGGLNAFTASANLFAEYATKNANQLHDQYVAGAAFTPIQLHVSALIVNKDVAKSLGVNVVGWESLKDAKLAGAVAYMDPAKSSPVSEQAAFVNSLAKSVNVAASAPSFVLNAVTAGQYAVGIVNEEKAIERKQSAKNVEIIYATEGAAMGASYAGILNGAQNVENAKLFLDFITSKAYQQAAADTLHQRSVRKDVDFKIKGVVATRNLTALTTETMARLGMVELASAGLSR